MDAEKFLERIGTEMQKGDWIDPKSNRSRFDDWVDVWWKTTVKLSPSTRRGYERMLKLYIRPVFDQRQIGSITWIDIELFVAAMTKEQRAPKTI